MSARRPLALFLCLFGLLLTSCRTLHLENRQERTFKRGLWVTRWDYKTPLDVRTIVANAAASGFDHILFQVRGNGVALYRSPFEPWSELLGGEDPGFDPLELAVREGRAKGLAVHAWINVVPGWRGLKPPKSNKQLWFTHPEWFLTMQDGKAQPLQKDYYVGLNICLPEVREYLAKLCADIVARYDVAGLHLDYIRFMERKKGVDFPYDKRSLALFAKETGVAHPSKGRLQWDGWRKGCLNKLVKRIRDAVKVADPRAMLSAAVFRSFARGKRVFQDAPHWARMRWVDALYPMLYERKSRGRYLGLVTDWLSLKRRYDVKVVAGLGSWLHKKDPKISVDFFKIARDLGASGVCVFAYAALFPTPHQDPSNPDATEREALRKALEPYIQG